LTWLWKFFHHPVDVEAIEGTNPKTDEPTSRKPSVDEPFASLAFKIAYGSFSLEDYVLLELTLVF
jgi:elongation factor G